MYACVGRVTYTLERACTFSATTSSPCRLPLYVSHEMQMARRSCHYNPTSRALRYGVGYELLPMVGWNKIIHTNTHWFTLHARFSFNGNAR